MVEMLQMVFGLCIIAVVIMTVLMLCCITVVVVLFTLRLVRGVWGSFYE